jgi:hypothetical protein
MGSVAGGKEFLQGNVAGENINKQSNRTYINNMSTKSPKQVGTKLQKMISAWTKLRPAKQFAGMTVEQFNEKVKPSLDTREELTTLRSQTTDSRLNHHDADAASSELAQFVVNSVKGDPEEGENSGLYAEMGYTPKADRRSGLTRKGPTTPPVAQNAVTK